VGLGLTADSGPLGHVRKGAVAVVVEKISALAGWVSAVVQQIGGDIDIEPTVAIIVAKGGHDARILHVQSIGMGHFPEVPSPWLM